MRLVRSYLRLAGFHIAKGSVQQRANRFFAPDRALRPGRLCIARRACPRRARRRACCKLAGRFAEAYPVRTSRVEHPNRLRSPQAHAPPRTTRAACLWHQAGACRRADAIPKYMRPLIFAASRCGLSGLSVTIPPPWNERPAPTRSGTVAQVFNTSGPPMQ